MASGTLKFNSPVSRTLYYSYQTEVKKAGETIVHWSLYMTKGNHRTYKVGPTSCYIHGKEVYSRDSRKEITLDDTLRLSHDSFTVKHNSSGEGSFSWSIRTAIYDKSTSVSSGRVNLPKNYPYSKCEAPSSLSFSGLSQYDGWYPRIKPNEEITLTWSGAKSGTHNSIQGYYIYYKKAKTVESLDNAEYIRGPYKKSTSSSSSYTFNLTELTHAERGEYVRFKLRTCGSAGSSYWSAYSAYKSCRINSLPTIPQISLDSTNGTLIEGENNLFVVKDSNSIVQANWAPVTGDPLDGQAWEPEYKLNEGNWQTWSQDTKWTVNKNAASIISFRYKDHRTNDKNSILLEPGPEVSYTIAIQQPPQISFSTLDYTEIEGVPVPGVPLIKDLKVQSAISSQIPIESYCWKIKTHPFQEIKPEIDSQWEEKILSEESSNIDFLTLSSTQIKQSQLILEKDFFQIGLQVTNVIGVTTTEWVQTNGSFFIGQKPHLSGMLQNLKWNHALKGEIPIGYENKFSEFLLLNWVLEPLRKGCAAIKGIRIKYEIYDEKELNVLRSGYISSPQLEYPNQESPYKIYIKNLGQMQPGEKVRLGLETQDGVGDYSLILPFETTNRGNIKSYQLVSPIVLEDLGATIDQDIHPHLQSQQYFFYKILVHLQLNLVMNVVFPNLGEYNILNIDLSEPNTYQNILEPFNDKNELRFKQGALQKLLLDVFPDSETGLNPIKNQNFLDCYFKIYQTDIFQQKSNVLNSNRVKIIFIEPPFFEDKTFLSASIKSLDSGISETLSNLKYMVNPEETINLTLSALAKDYNNDIQKYVLEVAESPIKTEAFRNLIYKTVDTQNVASKISFNYIVPKNETYSRFLYFRCKATDSRGNNSAYIYMTSPIIKGRETSPKIKITQVIKSLEGNPNDYIQIKWDYINGDIGGNLFSEESGDSYEKYNNFENRGKYSNRQAKVILTVDDQKGKVFTIENIFTQPYMQLPRIIRIENDQLQQIRDSAALKLTTELTLNTKPSTVSGQFTTITGISKPFIYALQPPTRADRAHHIGINTNLFQPNDVLRIESYNNRDQVVFSSVTSEGIRKFSAINLKTQELVNFIVDGGEW